MHVGTVVIKIVETRVFFILMNGACNLQVLWLLLFVICEIKVLRSEVSHDPFASSTSNDATD
jgi:hypothetical protein